MPIKAKPYFHQQMAFDFACNKFGITAPYITSSGVALLMEMGGGSVEELSNSLGEYVTGEKSIRNLVIE